MRRWIFRLLYGFAIVVVTVFLLIYVLAIWPQRVKHPSLVLGKGTMALEHARVYASPTEPVISDGTVIIQDGRIAAVGQAIAAPAGAIILPCDRCVVTAGFWNAHIHLTEPKWSFSNWKSSAVLNRQLAEMLTSRGFTTVVDTGSDYLETVPLRRRIESGELAGPLIYTAEAALYPPNGIPYYLRESLPKALQLFMPQPRNPEEAQKDVEQNLDRGADITKLFTGSYVRKSGHVTVLPMPLEIATGAVERSHQSERLVFAHPSNLLGTKIAVDSGVDVLAHAPDEPEGIDQAFLTEIGKRKMSMIPTLKMFATTVSRSPTYLDPIYTEVREFHQLGGRLIFGTDVGYMQDYSTEEEFTALAKCGLSSNDILAMLTTAPASLFGVSSEKGTIAQGKLADLTVLSMDPAQDVSAFSKVEMTIRSGRVIYKR
jgi:imidazolonepropionase-like amidohydrolase